MGMHTAVVGSAPSSSSPMAMVRRPRRLASGGVGGGLGGGGGDGFGDAGGSGGGGDGLGGANGGGEGGGDGGGDMEGGGDGRRGGGGEARRSASPAHIADHLQTVSSFNLWTLQTEATDRNQSLGIDVEHSARPHERRF